MSRATRQDSGQKPLSAFFASSKENNKPKSQPYQPAVVLKSPVPAATQVERAQRQPSWWSRASSFGNNENQNGSRKRSISQFAGSQAKKAAPWSDIAPRPKLPSKPSPGGDTKKLSEEQLKVLNQVLAGKSIFFTGAAGTGKSYLLHSIVDFLRRRMNGGSEVAVTATTGLAALNIGGQTVHRWGGLGLGRESASRMAASIRKRSDVVRRWENCKVLIIDEVSMLEADLFEKMEELARNLRNDTRPFGGIQLVITGDFFQLPPVSRGAVARLCFESDKWKEVLQEQLVLRKVFRQKDERLIGMLNCMRVGELTPDVRENFRKLSRAVCYEDGLAATQLYPRREQVEQANQIRMSDIKGQEFVFNALDSGTFDEVATAKLLENVMAPKRLVLKVGAQVLLVSNLADGLVNGSRGRVATFVNDEKFPLLRNLVTKEPRVLDIYNRVLEQNGSIDIETDDEMKARLTEADRALLIEVYSAKPRLPVVDFGLTYSFQLMSRLAYEVKGPPPHGHVVASRSQVPLILSWALSIHKAQGQTLDRLIVDLSKVFEKGQAYVAVSRATSFDRLQVLGFDEKMIRVDHRVAKFYSELERLN